MNRTSDGFQVVLHYKTGDKMGSFFQIEGHDKKERTRDAKNKREMAMDDAESWVERHARDFGYGAASVFCATLCLKGRALQDRS